jgi:hypothetical protein
MEDQVRGRILKLKFNKQEKVLRVSQGLVEADAPKAGIPRWKGSWWSFRRHISFHRYCGSSCSSSRDG